MAWPRFVDLPIAFGAMLASMSCGWGEGPRSTNREVPDDAAIESTGGLTGVEWRLVTLQVEDGAPVTPDVEAVPTLTFTDQGTPTGRMRFGGSAGATDSTVSTTREMTGAFRSRKALQ